MARVVADALTSKWDLTPDEAAVVVEATSAQDPTARHNPSFRRGAWDGFVRLFNRAARTLPAGLVPVAAAALTAAGYPVDTEEPEIPLLTPRPDTAIHFDLVEPHQLRALEAMCTYRRGIVHAATNAGKTKIAEAWCALHDLKIAYLVPTRELLTQTVASFRRDTTLDVGSISAEGGWHPGRDVTVILVTSVQRRKSGKTGRVVNEAVVAQFQALAKTFQAVIVDECHHLQADTWRWVLKCMPNAHYRYGLSGSPWNPKDYAAALRVQSHTGPIIATVTNAELIAKGWSAQPHIYMVPVRTAAITHAAGADYQLIYDEGIVWNTLRNSMIVKLATEFTAANKLCLILAHRIAQCEVLSELLHTAGIDHRLIMGQSAAAERTRDLADFKRAAFPVLISNVLAEGVDIPSLNGLIFAAGGKSSKKMLQSVGRGIRRKPVGANVVEIFDFDDRAHGILQQHTKERRRLYEREGFLVEERNVFF